MHVLFLREHNRIVDILKKINRRWNGERLYQETRKILTGIYQHIVYNEFLPALLGTNLVDYYGLYPWSNGYSTQYDINADAGTRNVFGAAAFRIGHSLVGSLIGSYDLDFRLRRTTPMEREFFNPRTVRDSVRFGVDGMSRWMLTQFSSEGDRFLSSSVRNHLFETKPGNGFDLRYTNVL